MRARWRAKTRDARVTPRHRGLGTETTRNPNAASGERASASERHDAVPEPAPGSTVVSADREQPVVVRLADLDPEAVDSLRSALETLPGVDRAEVVSGDERIARLYVAADSHLSARLIEPVLEARGLRLEAVELPTWATMRYYSVEASGGG